MTSLSCDTAITSLFNKIAFDSGSTVARSFVMSSGAEDADEDEDEDEAEVSEDGDGVLQPELMIPASHR